MTQPITFRTDLWNTYAAYFEREWGIDRNVAAVVGARGKKVFAAEYREHGDDSYMDSVVLPLRNAWYSAAVMETRWAILKDMDLTEPILDYGCGIGMTLLLLREKGFRSLYAHDLPGLQHKVMESVMTAHGIKVWSGEPVQTVLCINVLEHVSDPVGMLRDLMRLAPRVIANIDTSEDGPHIAAHEELEKCRAILEQKETLYRAA